MKNKNRTPAGIIFLFYGGALIHIVSLFASNLAFINIGLLMMVGSILTALAIRLNTRNKDYKPDLDGATIVCGGLFLFTFILAGILWSFERPYAYYMNYEFVFFALLTLFTHWRSLKQKS